jgi:hypothetical protein
MQGSIVDVPDLTESECPAGFVEERELPPSPGVSRLPRRWGPDRRDLTSGDAPRLGSLEESVPGTGSLASPVAFDTACIHLDDVDPHGAELVVEAPFSLSLSLSLCLSHDETDPELRDERAQELGARHAAADPGCFDEENAVVERGGDLPHGDEERQPEARRVERAQRLDALGAEVGARESGEGHGPRRTGERKADVRCDEGELELARKPGGEGFPIGARSADDESPAARCKDAFGEPSSVQRRSMG